ncbi:MAG TPA: hypothetical protein PLE71_17260 [Flavobacteriales bacterium]|nr:hypothetical protein [Flavobacteriales bacterium]
MPSTASVDSNVSIRYDPPLRTPSSTALLVGLSLLDIAFRITLFGIFCKRIWFATVKAISVFFALFF